MIVGVGLFLFVFEDDAFGAESDSCVGRDAGEGDKPADGDEDAVGVFVVLHREPKPDGDERRDGDGDCLQLAG